jgi:hypothetical protein
MKVSSRLLIVVAGALLAAACQTTSNSELVGKGDLILTERLAAFIAKANLEDRVVYDQQLAVDKNARNASESFCTAPAPAVCYSSSYNSSAEAAVANCSQGGKFDCGLYSAYRKVVWNGPVYVRPRPSSHHRPYNGSWPIQVTLPGGVSGTGSLLGTNGKLTISGVPGADDCRLHLIRVGRRDGKFELKCGEDRASGTYRRDQSQKLVGTGTDKSLKIIGFVIDMAKGQARTG